MIKFRLFLLSFCFFASVAFVAPYMVLYYQSLGFSGGDRRVNWYFPTDHPGQHAILDRPGGCYPSAPPDHEHGCAQRSGDHVYHTVA